MNFYGFLILILFPFMSMLFATILPLMVKSEAFITAVPFSEYINPLNVGRKMNPA